MSVPLAGAAFKTKPAQCRSMSRPDLSIICDFIARFSQHRVAQRFSSPRFKYPNQGRATYTVSPYVAHRRHLASHDIINRPSSPTLDSLSAKHAQFVAMSAPYPATSNARALIARDICQPGSWRKHRGAGSRRRRKAQGSAPLSKQRATAFRAMSPRSCEAVAVVEKAPAEQGARLRCRH
jgi:hypothetical protein